MNPAFGFTLAPLYFARTAGSLGPEPTRARSLTISRTFVVLQVATTVGLGGYRECLVASLSNAADAPREVCPRFPSSKDRYVHARQPTLASCEISRGVE